MTVWLDGVPVQDGPSGEVTLQEVIDAVRPTLPADTLVVAVALDERTLSEADLVQALRTVVPAGTRIDLTTGDRFEVTAAALREMGDQLNCASESLPAIADQLAAGQVAAAMQRLRECLQVWNQCQFAIGQSHRLVGLDVSTIAVDGRPVTTFVDELVAKLREIRDAFTAGDMVLLADLLRYEMPQVCSDWQVVLGVMAERVLCQAA